MPEPLRQAWPLPANPRPIVVIGAGSIVRDAHLPVYQRLGFPVAGIFDVKQSFMAGILVIADAPDGLNFQCVGPNTLADWRASGAKQIGESAQLKARDVASRALAALESGSPEFAFKAQACRPVPNFMKSENWPTIIELLKKWLAT